MKTASWKRTPRRYESGKLEAYPTMMNDPSLLQRKKGMSGCALAIIGAVTFFVLLVCLYWVWTKRCQREFTRQLDEIRERGEPVTAAEMDEFCTIPAGVTDTTELWVLATEPFGQASDPAEANLPIVGSNEDPIPPIGQPWDQLEEARAFLAQYDENLNAMHQAVSAGGAANFEVNFADGYNMILDDVQPLRHASRVLSLNARVQGHLGRTEQAVASLETMVAMEKSLENQPLLVSQLIRGALINSAADATGEMLGDMPMNDEQLSRLQSRFAVLDVSTGFRNGILGERCIAIQVLNPGGFGDAGLHPSQQLAMYVPQDTATYFSLMATLRDAMDKPFPQAKIEMSEAEQQFEELHGLRQVATKLMLPALSRYHTAGVRTEAVCKMAEAAIAIERFRLATGRLPDSLDELVPKYLEAAPIDPFDEQPVRYEIAEDGQGFKVYCVGADLTDNGGVSQEESDGVQFDEVFSVGNVVEPVEDEKLDSE